MIPGYPRQATNRLVEEEAAEDSAAAAAWATRAANKWIDSPAVVGLDSADEGESTGFPHSSSPRSKDTDGNLSPTSLLNRGAATGHHQQQQQTNVHILIKNTFIQFEDPSAKPQDDIPLQNRPRGESCDAVLYTQNIKDRCGCRTDPPSTSQLLCIPEYAQSPVELRSLVEEDDMDTPSKTTAADNEDSESQPSSTEDRDKNVFASPNGESGATPRRQNRQRNSNFTASPRNSTQEVSPAELMESLSSFEQTKRMPLENLPMPSHDRTTIMLRNIPNKYTQAMLLEAVNQDFRGLYDFFYLPIDFKNKCNVGYAFINFIHPYYAELFSTKFAGLKLTAFKSKKICEVSWGRVQGLRANIEHYRNSAIMSMPNSQYKPLIFKDGVPLQFPGPAGPVPSVKPRHGRNNHLTPQQA